MTVACQVDGLFEAHRAQPSYRVEQFFLSDRRFKPRRLNELSVDTGLDEAPKIVIASRSTPTEQLLASLETVIERFQSLKQLTAGWDSYAGRPVARAAVAPALRLVLDALLICRVPRIEANSEGGLDLIWEGDGRSLSISVDEGGLFEILYETEDAVEEPEELVDSSVARSFLERFCQHQ